VTCTRALLAIDTEARLAWRIDDANGVYYGICMLGERIYVGARRSPYGVDVNGRAAQRGVVLVYDQDLRLVETLEPPFPLRDVHQLHACDGKVMVACTHDDMVAEYSPAEKAWSRWFPFGEADEPNRLHLNSICHDESRLLLAGNKGATGTLYRFERGTREPLGTVELGKGSHNVWAEGDELFTCGSAEGVVRSTGGLAFDVSHYVRGVCSLNDTRVLGLSSNREDRTQRPYSDSELLILDRDWNITGRFLIPGLGMIHDVRAPGHEDLCHPGKAGPLLRAPEGFEAVELGEGPLG